MVTLRDLLTSFELDPRTDAPEIEKAMQLAGWLQRRAVELQTPEERRQQAELERMMQSPVDRETLVQMTDQAFRSKTPRRAADQLIHILDVQGIPRFFSMLDRAMLQGFQSFGSYLPGVSVSLVKEKMREETANVILPAETDVLARHLESRREQGVRMNVNYLGETLLGEDDARRRLESYVAALQRPEIECISVKATTIYSQIIAVARRHCLDVLCDRLEVLYRTAHEAHYRRADGTVVPKFVYVDMEEYRDLWLTVEAFLRTLERSGLEQIDAGIALQAYIPDSFAAMRRIHEWARARVAKGGSPVTIRLVKGANMEAERVEASIRGWPQAPFETKVETDANYKRMLHAALEPENLAAVRLGIATHNLFDVAYALVAADARSALPRVQFEMLEGMANHQRRALAELVPNLLLYAPATKREEFVNAIGYLIRRLDENTGPENFLRHAFRLEVGSEEWHALARTFRESFLRIGQLPSGSRRTQDRNAPLGEPSGPVALADFENEPDTDFSLEANLRWADGIIERWRDRHGAAAAEIPLVVAGREIFEGREVRDCNDPSRRGTVVGRYRMANDEDVERAIACARRDPTGWRAMDERQRGEVMARVAHELRAARGDLMGAALADGGKVLTESDPEVSEAVDFAGFYPASARFFHDLGTVDVEPRGVVVVVPPWNFPIAIPCGGVAGALAAGNTVILKPASDAVLVGYELCKTIWRAGVAKEVLQFLPCSGAKGGAKLVSSPDVDAVVLTGGTDTALRMLDASPGMCLFAETGGKNATIVTAMSDRELAIAHVLHSAFSHSGQKCSATSLLILEAEVYDDPQFKDTLCDAVRSLRVGSAWKLDSRMGPLIHAPEGDLERGLTQLEEGESWVVEPRRLQDNPALYSPGVKWGVRPGSYTHMTELFGPVLGVMRAKDLHEAIDFVNQTGYGLTSAIESLDEREQQIWRERIRAGNLYINRGTTGAIVQRQPFGGMGKSVFGPGMKAGGPNYVAQLMRFRDREDIVERDVRREVASPELEALRRALLAMVEKYAPLIPSRDASRVLEAIVSYDRWFAEEFGRSHDHQKLLGQDNLRRYIPVRELRVRIHPDDSAFEIFARVCAARTVGSRVTVSLPEGFRSETVALLDRLTDRWGAAVEFVEESDVELVNVLQGRQTDRIRYAARERVPGAVRRAAGESGIHIADAPPLAEGRIELLWYVLEQSISHDYHRYGHLGARSGEERREPD